LTGSGWRERSRSVTRWARFCTHTVSFPRGHKGAPTLHTNHEAVCLLYKLSGKYKYHKHSRFNPKLESPAGE
jgi:uncharacterized RmlC-like cupin family protein